MCLQPGWPGGLPRILGPAVSKEERERLGNDSPLRASAISRFPRTRFLIPLNAQVPRALGLCLGDTIPGKMLKYRCH